MCPLVTLAGVFLYASHGKTTAPFAMQPYLFHTCVIYLKLSNKMAAQNILSSGFGSDFVRLSLGNRGNGCTDFHETLSSDELLNETT